MRQTAHAIMACLLCAGAATGIAASGLAQVAFLSASGFPAARGMTEEELEAALVRCRARS
jgi:hypothetical protein